MARTRLTEKALFVERGYGQVEPNHLSAQRTGQIYAQLPAAADVKILENGQFAKYNYADGVVDFAGEGEWMLVFNEIKLYYDYQADHDFAMKAEDYNARVYSPIDADSLKTGKSRNYDFVSAGIAMDGTDEPFTVATYTGAKNMPEGTTMVPRLFKTNVGDIFTTNTVVEKLTAEDLGAILGINAEGYLSKGAAAAEGYEGMKWQVVKVYTMPDRQPGVKIMRIA